MQKERMNAKNRRERYLQIHAKKKKKRKVKGVKKKRD